MDIYSLIDKHIGEKPEHLYDSVRSDFDAYRLIRLYGRAVTIYEIMRLLQQRAGGRGLHLSRDRLYSALMDRLKEQQLEKEIELKSMASIDDELLFLVKRTIRQREQLFYEGEFRVVVPKLLQESYTERFRAYYELRFITERDSVGSFSKARSELLQYSSSATPSLTNALMDGETISFLAAFYKHCMDYGAINAKTAYTAKLGEIQLVDRLKNKYCLPDDETAALKYTLYRAVNDLSKKTQANL